jgi:hypothetical protein
MSLEAKVSHRPVKVAGRLYPTHAHRVNYALGGGIGVIWKGIHSIRRSFPRKRESTPRTVRNALSTDWIPAFAGMTAAWSARVSQ